MWDFGFFVKLYALLYLNMLSGNTDRSSSGDNTQSESSVGWELDSSSQLTKRQSHAFNHLFPHIFDEKVSLRKKVC